MKNSWQIVTLLLAAAVVILSLKVTTQSNPVTVTESLVVDEAAQRAEIGIDLIMTRSSVRSYTNQPVEKEKIETLLKAGMAAPTAGNRQPWQFVVVDERAILDKIPAFIPGAHMAAKAQQAIVVCGSPAESLVPDYWIQDCSAVTENILLAAHSLGLGAVWCGAFPNNAEDKVGQMKSLLSLPEGILPLSVIVFGYPDSEPNVKDKWKPEKVHYNRF